MTTENQSVLETLVGEGKKFKTVEDLAKGKAESDTHIQNLENQIKELNDKAKTFPELETILNDLKNAKTTSSTTDQTTNGKVLTEADIVALIDKRNNAAQIAIKQGEVLNEVKRIYADKSDEHLANVAKNLGFTVDQLKSLAGTNPEAFKRLVDIKPQTSTTSSVSSTTNSQSLTKDTVSGETKNKAYYDKKKSEMGIQKFVRDSALQYELHRNMITLGDAWDAS